jgi:hypothetical protein
MLLKNLKIHRWFIFSLLFYVVCSNLFLTTHSFSHQYEITAKHYFDKSDHLLADSEQCNLCSLFALQNKALSFAVLALAIVNVYLLAFFLKLDKIKIPFLFSSYLSQAPPKIS